MTTWTLSEIREAVRKVTGRLTSGDITNSELDEAINRYYQFTFPAEVKLDRKHTYYEFLTVPNQPWYTLPNTTYTNFEPPATVDNLSMLWYQDPAAFEQQNPKQVARSTPWTGDGVTTAFSTTLSPLPILPDSVLITDNTETFEDTTRTYTTSNVNITGSLGGTATINYDSGSIAVTFNTAPTNGQLIYLSYIPFKAGIPKAVLLYNNEFEMFPPPDTAYKFKVKSYAIVAELTNGTDTPDLEEWGLAIVYGTAKDLFAQYAELDAYAKINILYREQITYILTRTTQNLLNTRAMPQF